MDFTDDDFNPDVRSLALCSELDSAGEAIYQGVKRYSTRLDKSETDVFYFLYQTSIGIERLIKISHKLLEADDKNFTFKGGHDIATLNDKTIGATSIDISEGGVELIKLLSEFYKDSRYYNLDKKEDSKQSPSQLLSSFSHERLGAVIGNIVKEYYDLIRELSWKLNVFSYELNYDSNAAKIFHTARIDDGDVFKIFQDEQQVFREFIVALIGLHKQELSDTGTYFVDLEPLDTALYSEVDTLDTLNLLAQGEVPQVLIDLVNEIYKDMAPEDRTKRLNALSIFDATLAEGLLAYDDEE